MIHAAQEYNLVTVNLNNLYSGFLLLLKPLFLSGDSSEAAGQGGVGTQSMQGRPLVHNNFTLQSGSGSLAIVAH